MVLDPGIEPAFWLLSIGDEVLGLYSNVSSVLFEPFEKFQTA